MNDDQIKEVMRLADVIENLAWSAGKTEQYHDEPTDYAEKLPAARAELETYLRTIGEPVGYSLPAGSIGAKKFAQVGGGFTPVGLVFSRGESAMAITEHGRVYWDRDLVHPISGEPEQSVNAELLEALKGMVDAHAIPSSYCKERPVYNQARAAIARAESAIEGSHKHLEPWQPIETAPHDEVLLLACEFDGPGDWRIKCGYFNDDLGGWKVWGASWVPTRWAAIPAPPNLSDAARRDQTPDKVSPCAGHAVQQDADESCAHRFVRDEEAPRHLCCQACGEVKNEADEAGGA